MFVAFKMEPEVIDVLPEELRELIINIKNAIEDKDKIKWRNLPLNWSCFSKK
jgi:hypothetical protein